MLVQVKSGHVQRNIIATLKGDMEREKAELGLLVTLEPPTGPMEQEAASAGVYVPEAFPGPSVPARADRNYRGPAERPRPRPPAPRPRRRPDLPPRRPPPRHQRVRADAVGVFCVGLIRLRATHGGEAWLVLGSHPTGTSPPSFDPSPARPVQSTFRGGRSRGVKTPGCGPGDRGFDSLRSPH